MELMQPMKLIVVTITKPFSCDMIDKKKWLSLRCWILWCANSRSRLWRFTKRSFYFDTAYTTHENMTLLNNGQHKIIRLIYKFDDWGVQIKCVYVRNIPRVWFFKLQRKITHVVILQIMYVKFDIYYICIYMF